MFHLAIFCCVGKIYFVLLIHIAIYRLFNAELLAPHRLSHGLPHLGLLLGLKFSLALHLRLEYAKDRQSGRDSSRDNEELEL